ncbi:transaldolase [Corynebacterium glyciniphilum]|uniref:Transaldolase n=1 Tax=Corynebacterium glyciniphilum AJ 3170 TaxID=1404245 RepID=X5DTY5_9CORY|nr:transaldolase [Corynebacterium glyciniphilum]AHW64142.1 Transaldolase [Corynebacterium glyciniphilum AJ 3170]
MNHVTELAAAGTSVWLDDLSRDRLTTGNLAELISDSGIVGVTTNPAIFAKAMSAGTAYDAQVGELKTSGADVTDAVFAMAVEDVRNACDAFAAVHSASDGVDGRVSIEVDPRLADDREATVAQAKKLHADVGRDNVMIKIPATEACLPAITEVLAAGISVNVTLIFSVDRYRQVIAAFIEGIAQAQSNGHDVATIHSVASFFVSRVDTEIDRRLDEIGTAAALAVRGKAGLANARLAYEAFAADLVQDSRWQQLEAAGAHPQRPLWASTGVKNPDYPDTLYVTGLVGPQTVNTMPEDTLNATLDHATVSGDTLSGTGDDAREVFAALEDLGVDLNDVFVVLEHEGVEKFVSSWQELLDTIGERL